MDELTLRLPGELREQLEAEATERGVPVTEHVREIIEVHCRGEGGLDRPKIEIQYAHSTARATTSTDTQRSGRPENNEIGSFSYGSRSIFS